MSERSSSIVNGTIRAGGLRRLLLVSTALAAMLAPQLVRAEPPAELAQAEAARQVHFDIPAQDIDSALTALADQANLRLLFKSGDVAGMKTQGLSGSFTADEALRRLLAGTGMTWRFTAVNTVALEKVATTGAMELGPVTVEGQGQGPDSAWAEVARTTITPAELERKNPADIRQVFAGEPGIRVGGSVPMNEKVYVNGVEETNLAVSIDGSRQNNKVFHHSGTTLIDPSFLKVVRVDAGVAPADAGPGALAGAIAYETKDARDFLDGDGAGGLAKTSYNLNGPGSTTNLGVYGRHGWAEGLANVTYGKGGKFIGGDGERVRGSETDIASGLLKVAGQADSGDRLALSVERVYDSAIRPYRGNIGNIANRPAWEPKEREYQLDRRNWVATYTDATPTAWWNPKVVLAHGSTVIDLPIYTAATNYPGSGTTESVNGKAENTFTSDFGTLTAGLDLYRDKASYEDPTYAVRERANNKGLYAQARIRPWDPLRLSFGLRGDWQTFVGTQSQESDNSGWSPNVSGEVDVIPGLLTAKAGYSHTWAGVPLAENFIMNTAWTYANAPVPVKADNVSAGLAASHAGFTADWRVFQTKIDDARAAKFAAASGTLTRDVVSQGYEVGVGYAWADGFVRARYADIDVTIDGFPADSETGTYLAAPMGKIFTVGGAHTIRPWELTLGADLEVVLDNSNVVVGKQLKGYEVVNLFASYQLPETYSNVNLRVDVRNLFDETYADRATYGQEFGTVTPLYQPGRSVIFSAAAGF